MNTERSLSRGVQLALLGSELMASTLPRKSFLERASPLGISSAAAAADADQFLAIAANQAERRAKLLPGYDYIVVGAGAAGSVVGVDSRPTATRLSCCIAWPGHRH